MATDDIKSNRDVTSDALAVIVWTPAIVLGWATATQSCRCGLSSETITFYSTNGGGTDRRRLAQELMG